MGLEDWKEELVRDEGTPWYQDVRVEESAEDLLRKYRELYGPDYLEEFLASYDYEVFLK